MSRKTWIARLRQFALQLRPFAERQTQAGQLLDGGLAVRLRVQIGGTHGATVELADRDVLPSRDQFEPALLFGLHEDLRAAGRGHGDLLHRSLRVCTEVDNAREGRGREPRLIPHLRLRARLRAPRSRTGRPRPAQRASTRRSAFLFELDVGVVAATLVVLRPKWRPATTRAERACLHPVRFLRTGSGCEGRRAGPWLGR